MNNLYTTHDKVWMTRKLSWVLLLACLPLLGIHGQQPQKISLDVPRIVPVSPEATAMGKYQSYPVDHCTGIPDITIPLYEIVAGEVSIPVTLSYHASGLKPKERSGYAGTGWTLNLAPSVSRQINGVADDDTYGWFNRQYSWNTPPDDMRGVQEFYGKQVDNEYDTQPDKFSYRLARSGGNGYFFTAYDPLWTAPRNNDKVEYHHANGIEITDENGIFYSFNGAYEKTGEYITRWLCSSIRSARNPGQELVSFAYRTLPHYIHPNTFYNLNDKLIFDRKSEGNTHEVIMIEQNDNRYYRLLSNDPTSGSKEPIREMILPSETPINYTPTFSYITGDISVAQLQEVSFKGNKLSVSYKSAGMSPNDTDVFDKIEVRDENNVLVRTIRFFITPYNGKTSLTKLDSIRISAPGVEDRTYKFHYTDTDNVPSIYTTAVDHWGFCNGSDRGTGQTTVPSIREDVLLGPDNGTGYTLYYQGANREPSALWTQKGVLDRITNPDGLQTSFFYEGNSGAFRDNSKEDGACDYLHPVGGLRIARIEAYDQQIGKKIKKEYRYGLTEPKQPTFKPIWGGGAIKHIVTQRDYYSSIILAAQGASGHWYEYLTFYNSMPVSNIAFDNGSPVMYNVVSEEVSGQDENSQRTMYYYKVKMHDFEDRLRWDNNDPSGSVRTFLMDSISESNQSLVRMPPYTGHELPDDFNQGASNRLYGSLLRTEYFRNAEPVASTENIYSEKNFWNWAQEINVPERKVIISPEDYTSGLWESLPAYADHSYIIDFTTYRLLDRQISKRYHTVNGRRDVFTTEKKYNYEFDFADPGFSLNPRSVETIESDDTPATDTYDYLSGYPGILSYHKHTKDGKSRESRILFKPQSCLPEKVQSRTDRMTDYRDEVVYSHYDNFDNPVEIMGKDSIPVSFIWSYRNRFPIARIENATIAQVYSAMGVSDLEACAESEAPSAWVLEHIDLLRDQLPSARVTSYTYVPLKGVVSITDPNRVVTKYDYDSYSRLTEGYYLDPESRKVMLRKYVYHFGK